ncbi:GH25 family lysozyme [Listeria booriae]|uniref:GH25 family lysozyme n=1 Tax=Listeria booriae TaxID=1552123 RepID=UPI00164D4DD5|nr:GH25 family lysozyme [Listeria booriae]MBC6300292.1 glycoside hydrolase family 25 [Listeria booriae]
MAKILDISHHQTPGQFDWDKLKKELDGIIIRVQFGTNLIDRQYKNFIAKAKQHGIPFGLYAFGMFVSVADAKIEAQNFLKRGDNEAKFWVLDVEKETISACGTKNLAAASQAFIDVLKAAGKKTGFYYEHQYVGKYNLASVKADFTWIPRYGTNNGNKQPNYAPKIACDLWQYTSMGLAGSGKPVDLSDIHGDKPVSYFFGSKSSRHDGKTVNGVPLLPKMDFNSVPYRMYKDGTKIKVYAHNEYWYKAYVDNKLFYIYKGFCKVTGKADTSNRIPVTIQAKVFVWDNKALRGGKIKTYKPNSKIAWYDNNKGYLELWYPNQGWYYTAPYWLK